MYIGGSAENNHHIATYGDPSIWPYHNFINGARDKAEVDVARMPCLLITQSIRTA
jgi:alpha-L-fucosidase